MSLTPSSRSLAPAHAANFKVKCQRGSNVCTFQSTAHSGRFLCIESEGRVTSKA